MRILRTEAGRPPTELEGPNDEESLELLDEPVPAFGDHASIARRDRDQPA